MLVQEARLDDQNNSLPAETDIPAPAMTTIFLLLRNT